MRHEITREQKVAVLTMTVDGKTDDVITATTGLSADTIGTIRSHHGYPSLDRMEWAIDVLSGKFKPSPDPAKSGPSPATRPTAPTYTPKEAPPRAGDPRPVAVATPTVKPSANELIAAAGKSRYARTRNLGSKVATLLGDLSQRLAEEEAAETAKAEEEREAAKVKARIAKLQAEIDQLRGKTRKPRKSRRASAPAGPGDHACTHCDRTFTSPQGMRAHERRTHEGFDPHAVHSERKSA